MNGYQLNFFTSQNHRVHGQSVAHWLVEQARAMGIRGATLVSGNEGFGHHGRIHSAHFFELAEQPLEVIMAVTAEEADRLFAMLKSERLKLFYSKTPVEFGTTGESE
jgi:uncharacterized protein